MRWAHVGVRLHDLALGQVADDVVRLARLQRRFERTYDLRRLD